MKHVRIEDGGRRRWIIEVDGQDVAAAVGGFTVTSAPGKVTVVELTLPVKSLVFEGQALVAMPEATRQMLIGAGWVPPDEGAGVSEPTT